MKNARGKLLSKYVLPTVLGSVCFFLFTIVDGIFIGRGVGIEGTGAVNLTMPFVIVVNALFQLTTIGGVTVIAIRKGRGDDAGANRAFMHSLTFALVVAAILCLSGVCVTGPLCKLMGATETYYGMSTEYLFWYSVFIVPSGLSAALQGFCRNDGSPVLVSIANVVGAALNIALDYAFIFPLRAGLKGAAIATGVSQTAVFLILTTHFLFRRGRLRLTGFTPDFRLYGKIALRGLPECISQCATAVTTLWLNQVLTARLGDVAVNAFGVISYVASFSMGIFFGVSEGLQPLFGNSYGARDGKSLKFYFRAGLIINFLGALAVNGLLLAIGGKICGLFGATGEALAYTVRVLPFYAWGFIVTALNTIVSAYLFSTKRTAQALVVNVLRSFVVNTFVILLFPQLFGDGVIWHTFGISESIVLLAAILLLAYSERRGIDFKSPTPSAPSPDRDGKKDVG